MRFRRSGITCGEERKRNRGGGGERREDGKRGRKTGGSAPTEFFGSITDLYFTPDLLSNVYVFNILDARRVHARANTDASRSPNIQRSTNSYFPPRLPLWSSRRSPPSFLSFLHKSAIFYPLSSRCLFLPFQLFFFLISLSRLLPPLTRLACL